MGVYKKTFAISFSPCPSLLPSLFHLNPSHLNFKETTQHFLIFLFNQQEDIESILP